MLEQPVSALESILFEGGVTKPEPDLGNHERYPASFIGVPVSALPRYPAICYSYRRTKRVRRLCNTTVIISQSRKHIRITIRRGLSKADGGLPYVFNSRKAKRFPEGRTNPSSDFKGGTARSAAIRDRCAAEARWFVGRFMLDLPTCHV